MKLWNKGKDVNKEVEEFSVGKDYILDEILLPYDLKASKAHAKMLNKIGILSDSEIKDIIKGLNLISKLHKNKDFKIKVSDEDCHTAIENFLVKEIGDAGKKIHTARSRNDQVLTAIRLYQKDSIKNIIYFTSELSSKIEEFGAMNKDITIPGYSHMQKAMPLSIQTWIGSFSCALKDSIKNLEGIYSIIDQSPLGSAAGFGVPLIQIDKNMTSKELGFSKVQENPVYAQLSRAKFDMLILSGLNQIMFDLNRISTDLITFSMKEFSFVSISDNFSSGSSIMPQKKNQDVLELIRGNYHIIQGYLNSINSISANLISGYNRDMQLTKEIMINSFEITKKCLNIMSNLIKELKVNKNKCGESLTQELFATEEAYKLVLKGVPFREAYKRIGKKFS